MFEFKSDSDMEFFVSVSASQEAIDNFDSGEERANYTMYLKDIKHRKEYLSDNSVVHYIIDPKTKVIAAYFSLIVSCPRWQNFDIEVIPKIRAEFENKHNSKEFFNAKKIYEYSNIIEKYIEDINISRKILNEVQGLFSQYQEIRNKASIEIIDEFIEDTMKIVKNHWSVEFPAIELKMFAADKKYIGKNLSSDFIKAIIATVRRYAVNNIGANYFILYSVPDKVNMYKRNGLSEMPSEFSMQYSAFNKDCVPMFMDISL